MEAVGFFKTLVHMYKNTRRYILKDCSIYSKTCTAIILRQNRSFFLLSPHIECDDICVMNNLILSIYLPVILNHVPQPTCLWFYKLQSFKAEC